MTFSSVLGSIYTKISGLGYACYPGVAPEGVSDPWVVITELPSDCVNVIGDSSAVELLSFLDVDIKCTEKSASTHGASPIVAMGMREACLTVVQTIPEFVAVLGRNAFTEDDLGITWNHSIATVRFQVRK